MHRMRESGRWGVGKWVNECVGVGVYVGVLCARTRQQALPFALTAGCYHRRGKASAPRHQPEREARESTVVLLASGSSGRQQQQQQ